ncbi:MAG TPA: Hint domain-containing protein [Cyclobacteriaceae bacterium]|nr:Hint domain-containing protein [Cyclobacteriaceae bacterium]
MIKILTATVFLFSVSTLVLGQDQVNPRPITLEEYEKAKTFQVNDLDNDTYVKFENTYLLDRYEMRKPYFITGDDGLKKRMDIYKLIAKNGLQELGTMVFYTNENGKLYKALLPNFTADAKVWERYFEDIHSIDKEEKNFVLKLSYVLSKEVSYQQYKFLNQGKDLAKESATYGNNICFPGDQEVLMNNGTRKYLKDIVPGDEVMTVDPSSHQPMAVKVRSLTTHEASNYAITRLTLLSEEIQGPNEILLQTKFIEATPNHPMLTNEGTRKIGEISEGESILCFDRNSGQMKAYLVFNKTEFAGGTQKVFNIEATEGETFLMNDVMVLRK